MRIICCSKHEVGIIHTCNNIPHAEYKREIQTINRRVAKGPINAHGSKKRAYFILCHKPDIMLNNVTLESASRTVIAYALV